MNQQPTFGGGCFKNVRVTRPKEGMLQYKSHNNSKVNPQTTFRRMTTRKMAASTSSEEPAFKKMKRAPAKKFRSWSLSERATLVAYYPTDSKLGYVTFIRLVDFIFFFLFASHG
jgi:hypothetical protein